MNNKGARWIRWQRGQALTEYWPTIPLAIAVIVAASMIVQFLNSAFMRTVDALDRTGLECQVEGGESSEQREGPLFVQMGDHSIELVAVVYDPDINRTTVTYHVTSGPSPSISHWVLEFPGHLRSRILSASEPYEFGTDPTTGVTGIKFDTGYEVEDDEEAKIEDSGQFARPGKQGGVDPGYDPLDEARNVFFTLMGEFDFTATTVSIKAGQNVHYGSISAPTSLAEEGDDSSSMCP